jgi:hypothetical protein
MSRLSPRDQSQTHVATDLEKKLGKEIQKSQGRAINTRRGGPNMPTYQPCPFGHGLKKRKAKTMGGATYYCNQCKGGFFVRAK